MYGTPPKRGKGIASSPKPPPSQKSTLPSAGASKGAGMKSMGVASSAAKSTLTFAAPSSSSSFQCPVTSESQDYLKSLCVSKKTKMIELNSLLDSKFTAMAKDNVLGGLPACGLRVEEDAFKNIKSIPDDSFFRNFIPYFPQFKQQEPGVAAHNIHKLLCAFVAAEGDNFSQVIFLLFSEDLLFRCRDDKHLLLFVKLVVINYYFNDITGAKVDTCHKCKKGMENTLILLSKL